MEREAKMLREMQAQAETEASQTAGNGEEVPMDTEEDKSAADTRSVHIGNVCFCFLFLIFRLVFLTYIQVDYSSTPEEIQTHFNACGTINRVTILCDKFTGHPKGYKLLEIEKPNTIHQFLADMHM
jgi:polyadenylate-binding protein 2